MSVRSRIVVGGRKAISLVISGFLLPSLLVSLTFPVAVTASSSSSESVVDSKSPWINDERFSTLSPTTQSILQSCTQMIPPSNTYLLQLQPFQVDFTEVDPDPLPKVEIKHRVCNPNLYLDENEVDYLNHVIYEMESVTKIPLNSDDESEGTSESKSESESKEKKENQVNEKEKEESGMPIELAVVIIDQMEPIDVTSNMESESGKDILINQATTVARELHDTWGVGRKEAGGTGILIFVSITDRTMYISVSNGIQLYLDDARLDTIMDQMKSHLRDQNYAQAIHQSIVDIHYAIDEVKTNGNKFSFSFNGKKFSFSFKPKLLLAHVLVIAFYVRALYWAEERQKLNFIRRQSQLSKKDREKALALMRKYQPTSCAICTEDFEVVKDGKDGEDGDKFDGSARVDSKEGVERKDGEPGQQHDVAISISGGNASSTLRRRNVSSGGDGDDGNSTSVTEEQNSTSSGTSPTTCHYLGSDGKAVKLLRCGHIFCQCCFDDWIRRGSNVTQCPFCKQDISVSDPSQPSSDPSFSSSELSTRDATRNTTREMHIHESHVTRWSSPTYDGQLSRDQDFVQHDPLIQRESTSSGSASSSGGTGGGFSDDGFSSEIGFGGGSSSGGRGGSW